MDFELTSQQRADRAGFRAFAEEHLAPHAASFDAEQRTPDQLVERMGRQGYLGAAQRMDMITFGLLAEALARGSASVHSLLTVHSMVTHAIGRFGTGAQKANWLPRFADGSVLGGFALSEPEAGSDAGAARTTAVQSGGGWVLDGCKTWISYGELAGIFLVLARAGDQDAAFLVERGAPGLEVDPIRDMLGFRAAMLATVTLHGCRVPPEALLGRVGSGMRHVIAAALDLGRYSVAWGCTGLADACLEASVRHARARKQFGAPIADRQLIQRMLSRMIAGVSASRLLCLRAGWLRDKGDPRSVAETLVAKYFASRNAGRAAADAVQIHGAAGCAETSAIARHFRDARVMEIIEGSTQILETMIAPYGAQLVEGAPP